MTIDLKRMLDGYIECADWADCNVDCETHGHEWSAELRERMEADCKAFIAAINAKLPAFLDDLADLAPDYSDERLGHDFWLTRNGHGAGYWDRKELKHVRPFSLDGKTLGDTLTSFAEKAGPCELYVGDDGMVYA